MTKAIGAGFGRLVTGQGRKEISSPVGITRVSSQAVQTDFRVYLQLLAFISLSLALLNLLPLLPLDGGHIAFSLVEGIRHRAVGREVYERVSIIGIALVLMLFFIGLSNDLGGAAAGLTAAANRLGPYPSGVVDRSQSPSRPSWRSSTRAGGGRPRRTARGAVEGVRARRPRRPWRRLRRAPSPSRRCAGRRADARTGCAASTALAPARGHGRVHRGGGSRRLVGGDFIGPRAADRPSSRRPDAARPPGR